MKKLMAILLLAVVAAIGPAAPNAAAKKSKATKAPGANQLRWHGTVVRTNKDASTLDVSKGNVVRIIHYDSATQWTNGTKPIDAGGVKEGDDVIVLGRANENKEILATRIDLRPPK